MYSIEVAPSYKSSRTGRICKSVQDWIAYITKPDGTVEVMAGWATRKQAWRIANEYVLKQLQRSNQEA
jgi:hypothetical protein